MTASEGERPGGNREAPAEEPQHDSTPPQEPAPRPPSELVPKKQVDIKQPREQTGESPTGLTEGTEIGGQTVARLIALRPFMTYFCWLAHRQNPAAHRPETRVSNLRAQNPKFYWLCVAGDVLVIIIAVMVLIAAATGVLYKTIWL